MKIYYNLLVVALLLPFMAVANTEGPRGKYKAEKKIHKEYEVSPSAALEIDNSYGSIDIVTWNENRTVIDVSITTHANSESKANEKLKEIKVDFTANSSLVKAVTRFGSENKSLWSSWFGDNDNVSMEINYTIKIPITNAVDLDNDYGTIRIDRLEGHARINCDYGQLIIGELLADDNYLEFDYTSKSTIQYMKSGHIDADYSGFTLDKVEKLELEADYTSSEIGEVADLDYDCDYGTVKVGKATNVVGRGDYISNKLGIINGDLNLNTDYGSIIVEKLTAGAKEVVIRSDYTGVKVGFDEDYTFDFTLNLDYASFKGSDTVEITKSHKDSTEKRYAGYHKTENSGNTVSITSDYGGVTFFKN
ncbi:hypothetical protein SCB49_12599 [unidentified eubacterium SCB49]|nr:hypothetical protein SCB49_12599 [unidentified eubacterium SCB49]